MSFVTQYYSTIMTAIVIIIEEKGRFAAYLHEATGVRPIIAEGSDGRS
jgi:hypothetical protein